MIVEPADGPLPLARRQLGDAVHALADPIPVWDGGVCRWSDAVYVRMRGELPGGARDRRGLARSTRLPCRGDVLDWLIEVDRTVAAWEPNGKGTVDRLHELAGRGFRPQDCELIDDYADDLQRWTLAATEILAPAVRVTLRQPCPSCGAGHAYRDSGGEQVRSRALRVTETGCKCLACGASWPAEKFEWLARLLGCEPLSEAASGNAGLTSPQSGADGGLTSVNLGPPNGTDQGRESSWLKLRYL